MNRGIGAFLSIIVAIGIASSPSFAQSYSLGKIQASSLNVRSGSSTSSPVVSKLSNGSEVVIVDESNGWYKIQTGSISGGWISSEYASIVQKGVEGVVNAESVNARQGASLQSSVVASLGKGSRVTVIDKSGEWFRVSAQSHGEVYINEKYVDIPVLNSSVATVSRGSSRDSNTARYALSFVGKKYSWGAEGPDSFDCSGFTRYVYKNSLGKSIPHSAKAQSAVGEGVSKGNLSSGDLVFFTTDRSGSINHAGIYIGNGKFVHASSAGGKVMVSSLDSGFYEETYKGARRLSN